MNTDHDMIQATLDDWSARWGYRGALRRIPSVEDQLFLSDLTEREHSELDSHRHPQRRRSWIAGRMAAKQALRDWGATRRDPLDGTEILRAATGKPNIVARQDLHVTISHSGEYAVALVGNRKAGIDIERREDRPDSLARAFFSVAEQEWVGQIPSLKTQRCDVVWTRKEAVSKLLGTGGQALFSSLAVLEDTDTWILETVPMDEYTLSLALEKGH